MAGSINPKEYMKHRLGALYVVVPTRASSTKVHGYMDHNSLQGPFHSYSGHPLGQRPYIPGLLGSKDLTKPRFGFRRPHFGGTGDVEGIGKELKSTLS